MENKKWSTLQQDIEYSNERGIYVFKQAVKLPTGKILDDYYQVSLRNFVTMIVQDVEGRYLCLEQYKHGVGEVALTLPGGLMEESETSLTTAKRELLEEAGYQCETLNDLGKYVLSGNQRVCYSHIVSGIGARKICDAIEPDQENPVLVLLTKSELLEAFQKGRFPIISHTAAIGMELLN